MTVDPRPPQQQVRRGLRVNYMELMRSSRRSHSQIKVHKTKIVGAITSKIGPPDWATSYSRHYNCIEDG